MKKVLLWLGFCMVTVLSGMGQRKFAVQGSSTAACVGAVGGFDSCWLGILERYYNSQTQTFVYQVARGGYNPYHGMPTGFVPPSDRPNPDPAYNVTKSLSFAPNVVIISYPSNQYNSYSVSEVMLRYRQIFEAIEGSGVVCFIMTPQPRHNSSPSYAFNDYDNSFTKKNMWEIRDSVMAQFGEKAINVWDTLVNPLDTTLRAEFNYGDNIHLNNAGHRFLSRAVIAKDIFAAVLPLNAVHFNGERVGEQHRLYWEHKGPEKIKSYELHWSPTGNNFVTLYQASGDRTQYAFIHEKPAEGANWYRLKWVDDRGKTYYSARKNVFRNMRSVLIQQRLFTSQGWELQVYAPVRQSANLTLLDAQGSLLWQSKTELKAGWQSIIVPVQPFGSRSLQVLQLVTEKQRLTEKLIRPN